MPTLRRFAATLSGALIVGTLVSCDRFSPTATVDTCVRPAEKPTSVGAVVELRDSTNYPCTIKIVNTGVVLSHNFESDSIGYSAARGPDGRFYTSPLKGGAELQIWNADGTFQRNFGKLGDAPGDLAAGAKFVQFDSSGRIYVGDNNRRWSVFTPNLEFVASIPALESGIKGNGNTGALLGDGNFLSSVHSATASFRVFDFNGRDGNAPPILREFGPPPPAGISSARRVSYIGGDTFWAGPLPNAGQGYVIEQWRTDGTLLKSIHRSVSWMPQRAAGVPAANEIPAPDFQLLYSDSTDVLFVSWIIFRDAFGKLTPEERADFTGGNARDKSIDVYVEAIDAKAGVVLASTGPIHPSASFGSFPIGYFPGGRDGYVRDENRRHKYSIRMTRTLLLKR